MCELEQNAIRTEILDLLNFLPEREKYILCKWLGLEGEKETLRSLGKCLGISGGRTGQLKDKALRRLRRKKEFRELIFQNTKQKPQKPNPIPDEPYYQKTEICE